jgi:hypothetical protein
MRLPAGLAVVLGCCAAGHAAAQSDPAASRLMSAPFAPSHQAKQDVDAIADLLLERETIRSGAGPFRTRTTRLQLRPAKGGAVDSVRVRVEERLRTPAGVPLNLQGADYEARDYEVALTRDWPGAVRFEAGDYDLDVTPHAGLGVSSAGGQAEAGATVTFGQRASDAVESRLKSLGVRDGASFGDQGRWYLFAAASGRAVGLNILRDGSGWDRAGWSTDASSKLVGDAHVGVGWRKGPLQTSFGYIHREVKGEHMLMGQDSKEDSVVAFSLSVKPGR